MNTESSPQRPFAPWKPFWLCAIALVFFATTFGVGVGGWFLHETWNGGPSWTVVGLWSPFALVGFFGMAASGFAAIISLWIGALTRCPKCGNLFAAYYFATKCRSCGAAIFEVDSPTLK